MKAVPLNRNRDRTYRLVLGAAFFMFGVTGIAYMVAPPRTTADFLDSSWPSVVWGFVFLTGAVVALLGTWTRKPLTERLGLMLIIIAGVVLTAVQALVMFDPPITWTRGGGTAAYAGFALVAWALHIKLGSRVDIVNLAADIEPTAEGGRDG